MPRILCIELDTRRGENDECTITICHIQSTRAHTSDVGFQHQVNITAEYLMRGSGYVTVRYVSVKGGTIEMRVSLP